MVVDRVGPRDRQSPPRFLDRWWPVVEAAAGAVHGALRRVDGRRADAVGDHRPGRRPSLFGGGVPPGLQADQRGAVDARGRGCDRSGRRGAHAGVVLLHVPRDVGADARGAGAVGRRPAPRRQAGHGVRARGRGGFDPARGLAVHRALRAVVVAARAAPSVVGRRRMGLDPGAVVRASVGGVRSAVPGLRPRQGLQRPSRQEPVPRGATTRRGPADPAGADSRRRRRGDRLVQGSQQAVGRPGSRRRRLVGARRGDDARRLSRPRALLSARGRADVRAGRRVGRAHRAVCVLVAVGRGRGGRSAPLW